MNAFPARVPHTTTYNLQHTWLGPSPVAGKGTRPFLSGGAINGGLHGGTFTTFWNVRASSPVAMPPLDVATFAGKPHGFYLNFIG